MSDSEIWSLDVAVTSISVTVTGLTILNRLVRGCLPFTGRLQALGKSGLRFPKKKMGGSPTATHAEYNTSHLVTTFQPAIRADTADFQMSRFTTLLRLFSPQWSDTSPFFAGGYIVTPRIVDRRFWDGACCLTEPKKRCFSSSCVKNIDI
ncbi:hypothetical protein BDR06DRAFT_562515 [Suillus hirtellus]|nr:hypothetical protein BDR06DRAFT_562515 [Suillus hirtellus]